MCFFSFFFDTLNTILGLYRVSAPLSFCSSRSILQKRETRAARRDWVLFFRFETEDSSRAATVAFASHTLFDDGVVERVIFLQTEFERCGFKRHKLNLTFGRALKACLDVLGPETRMAHYKLYPDHKAGSDKMVYPPLAVSELLYTREATVTLLVPESSSPSLSARGAASSSPLPASSSFAGAAFCIARLLRKA